MYLKKAAVAIVLVSVLAGCTNRATEKQEAAAEEGTYLSLRQYARDLWQTYHNQPITFEKTVRLNGQADTTFENIYQVDWASVFEKFFSAEISDPKFLGRYGFQVFDDESTGLRTYAYEALEPELFTRLMHISVDPVNQKIRSIYIETSSSGDLTYQSRKLYFAPLRVIQIQEREDSRTGPDRELLVQYRFLL
jgi:hypothetical protein